MNNALFNKFVSDIHKKTKGATGNNNIPGPQWSIINHKRFG